MKKSLLLILFILLINCESSENSSNDPQVLINIPVKIKYNGSTTARLFRYDNKKLIETDITNIEPHQIYQPGLFKYDSSNRIEKFTDFFDNEIIFDLIYDENNRIISYKNTSNSNVHTNKVDLLYNGNSITYTIYTKDLNSDTYELSHSQNYIIENGNIIRMEIPEQSITEYFYDENNSPFSNIDGFENFQTIFSNFGVMHIADMYEIRELFYGKNNIIRQEYTYLPTGEVTITDYQNEYNSNDYPNKVNNMNISYD